MTLRILSSHKMCKHTLLHNVEKKQQLENVILDIGFKIRIIPEIYILSWLKFYPSTWFISVNNVLRHPVHRQTDRQTHADDRNISQLRLSWR